MTGHSKFLFITVSLAVIGLLGNGCTTAKTTDTVRSGTEELLLSTATDHALRSANLELFANRKIFLDTAYFDSYDSKYAIGTIRDALSRAGAILEENAGAADIIVEARSGALATDNSETLFGIPTFSAPVPLAGAIAVPEIAFYKSSRQDSVAKIALLAFAKTSREHIYSSGPLDGTAHDRSYRCLFIAWVRTDVPEMQKTAQKMQERQTWFPQYDEMNMPPINTPTASTNATPATAAGTNAPAETSTNDAKAAKP